MFNCQSAGTKFYIRKFENLYFERDTEPYAITRDKNISEICLEYKINVETFLGHTLYDPNEIVNLNKGICPAQYGKFTSLIEKLPKISQCQRDPKKDEIKSFKNFENGGIRRF